MKVLWFEPIGQPSRYNHDKNYAGTWQDKHFSFKEWLKKLLPECLLLKILELKSKH